MKETVEKAQFCSIGDGLLVRAPGKINLWLLIGGQRSDGFHEIDTLMSKVTLYDDVFIEAGSVEGGIEVIAKGCYWAPGGRDNLIYAACEKVFSYSGYDGGVKVTLTKNLPAGSGMGSASSDAAGTVSGLNKYFDLGLTKTELYDIASSLGSDVAFFLGSGLGICTGRGEKVDYLRESFDFNVLLVFPDISVSTKEVYENYHHDDNIFSGLKSQIGGHMENGRIDLASKMCANMLEKSCFSLHKELSVIKTKLDRLGFGRFCLSGSGSVMYCLFDEGSKDKVTGFQEIIANEIGCKSVIVSNNRW